MSKKQTSVAEAEQIIAELERKRSALVERGAKLAEQRRVVSYQAHVNHDPESRKQLSDITEEALRHEHELASVGDAIAQAQGRLLAAQADEAKAADREGAKELRGAVGQLMKHAASVDAALELLIESTNGLQQALTAMHRCGSGFPSDAQLQSLGGRVLLGALGKTIFRRSFEVLPPLERNRTMAATVRGWSETVERSIRERLGEQTTETAA